ncbi:hypothetical protein R5H30_04480 [Sulfitobacter sp. D35]|uniref:hypothetical protein n=1 Tax=Sulfitobacter sp. D35 TaxID=3083252 RepID=UPI00296FB7B8|nr:hypothetical protein [Sulfitobacter sp. D35]MDW4497228.1 hypothetical protein [Sulfitobacter sp. D35]
MTARRFAMGAAMAFLAGSPALAQDWEIQVTPYAWLLGMEGDVGSFGLPAADVDLSFGDILDNLDYAVFMLGVARRDDFAVFFDGSISRLSYDQDVSGPNVDDVELVAKTSNFMLSVGGTLSRSDTHRLEAYGGARAWWLRNDFEVRTAAGRTIQRDSDADWVDPVVGLVGTYRINDRFTLFGNAEVGGFGVGSDMTWSIFAGTTYNINDTVNVAVGWRHMSVDYSDDEVIFDVDQTGPVIGATFRF